MFNNKLTKKVLSITSAIAIMGAMAVPSLAAQTTPVTGKTNVIYTSGSVVPGPSGALWGVEIPSGVSFTDKDKDVAKTGMEYDVKIVSLDPNGKSLSQLYSALQVETKVSSQNGYRFVKTGSATKVGRYEYKVVGGTALQGNTTEQVLGTLDIATDAKSKIQGEFTLKETVTEKGSYKDILTYNFTQKVGTLK